ncbi:putative mfs multidrug [Phaeomoniella chlamydospora]|uniref:Putative mfs multidrug n=1 Tax=Phaeomoniella chlamydospora TaxID=158046 RepID=A0A0G2GND7_PHACM|nr:putative mfs multidrug [Phaeomoniella chlamydospora]
MGLAGTSFYVCIVSIPERAQIVNNKSVLTSGVYLLPFLGSMAFSMVIWGGLNGKKNRIGPCLIVAACLQLLGQGLLSTLPATEEVPKRLFGYEVLIAFGVGGYYAITPIVAAVECENADRGIAQGIVSQSRFLGGSIGLAIAALVLNNKVKDALTGVLSPAQLRLLYDSPITLKQFPPEQQQLIRHVYSDGFNDIMRVMTYITAAMVPLSILTLSRNPPPIQKRIEDGGDDNDAAHDTGENSETRAEHTA